MLLDISVNPSSFALDVLSEAPYKSSFETLLATALENQIIRSVVASSAQALLKQPVVHVGMSHIASVSSIRKRGGLSVDVLKLDVDLSLAHNLKQVNRTGFTGDRLV